MTNRERVIVALDLDTTEEALSIARKVAPIFPYFKIGSRLFTQAGPPFVKEVLKHGRVFLDLKFYDIPTVVAEAAYQAAQLGVSLVTLHASGGSEMMRQCSKRLRSISNRPHLLAVTVLTSFGDLKEFGIVRSVSEQVKLLAQLA
ncbi:MAG: orotidine-5'-phosphate decarboxylase, partial [Acidobacteria bacterium]